MEKLHIQPSEIEKLPYYEFEYTVEIYNDIMKERNEEEKKQSQATQDNYDINKMQKKMSSYKQPSMPKISMPRF